MGPILCSLFVIFAVFPQTFANVACGLYGQPPCEFLPAPPHTTPPCARPGDTFCEHVANYPAYRIQQLIRKWGYEAENLIVDETQYEFESLEVNSSPKTFYDPAIIFAQHLQKQFKGYKYDSPPNNGDQSFTRKPSPDANYLLYGPAATPNVQNGAPWKRYVRDLNAGNRGVSRNLDLFDIVGVDRQYAPEKRVKRQEVEVQSLCRTRAGFKKVEAALNSEGNWMFVVNSEKLTQLIKIEICDSDKCDEGLCQVPNGYRTKCVQKQAQRRLIALKGDGSTLYTDTFWFPSCCECTIVRDLF